MEPASQVFPKDRNGLASFGNSMALSADGNTAIVGGPGDNNRIGAVWVFTRQTLPDGSSGPWQQQGSKITPPPALGAAQLGYSVAVSWDGNTLAAGAWAYNGFVGVVLVYRRNQGAWTLQSTIANPEGQSNQFGASVAMDMDGQTLIIGAPKNAGQQGAAWLFSYQNGGWTGQAKYTPTDSSLLRFGLSVAISADATVKLIGAAGAVWVHDDGETNEDGSAKRAAYVGQLPIGSGVQPGTVYFGWSVALSALGDTALVGAVDSTFRNPANGCAFVYTRPENANTWTQQGPRLAVANPYYLANTVRLSADGSTAILGDWSLQAGGLGYVFALQDGSWQQQGAALAGATVKGLAGYSMGGSVAISADGNAFLIGAYDQHVDAPSWSFDDALSAITHVFVLMLENHSFDNIFGLSGLPGVLSRAAGSSNAYPPDTAYPVAKPALPSMPTDPAHEFSDVMEQMCGSAAQKAWVNGADYPAMNMSGFASNYATSTTEIHRGNPRIPTEAERGEIMKCFDTPAQLPVLYKLATEFVLCDQWYSSLPGPTFPNRAFLHGGSSSGLADSPTGTQTATWLVHGFAHANGNIFGAMQARGRVWRIFVDPPSPTSFVPPPVCLLKGVHYADTYSFNQFATSVASPHYPEGYTFIEPNYGEVVTQSFKNGSSMHPMDGVHGGETLVKNTYEAIRNSPHWNTSLLVIVFDEHGGFFDSMPPTEKATAPGDPANYIGDTHFDFTRFGVRVPALVISPRVAKGAVDHTLYDHTSVLATLTQVFDTPHFTQRVQAAQNLLPLLNQPLRTDCPTTLPDPLPVPPSAREAPEEEAAQNAQPLPTRGAWPAFLAALVKTDLEGADKNAAARQCILANASQLKTVGEARTYAQAVGARATQARP